MKTKIMTLLVTILIFAGCAKENQAPRVDIHMAALVGNLEAINQHIKAGSDLNVKDEYGSTPLIIASVFGKTNVAQALIKAGVDLNLQNNEGSTALITAALFCRTEIVKALLDNGTDKTIQNKYGNTALDAVSAPFEDTRSIYDYFAKSLGPLGLVLDYEQLKTIRPKIADMLR